MAAPKSFAAEYQPRMNTKHFLTITFGALLSISAAATQFKLVCRDPQMNFLVFVEESPGGKPAMSYGVQELDQIHMDKLGDGYSISGSYRSGPASGTLKLTVSAEQVSKPVPFEAQVTHQQSAGCQPSTTSMIPMLCTSGMI